MSVCVIGQGFVGGSLTTVLSEAGETVYAYDKLKKRAKGAVESWWPSSLNEAINFLENGISGRSPNNFSKVYFVCLPTPMYEDGAADLSIVQGVLDELASFPGERIAVVKSTVPPGTTENWNKMYENTGLRVIFNPEFLTEANALNDMRNQNRIVLGGPRPQINTVKNVFQRAFPNVPIIKTSSTTAEMIKYVTNCMLAVKVSFANEVAQICEKLDADGKNIDYDKVVEYAKFDKRLGDTHWSVPGPVPTHDGRYVRGFGGHCLVADTVVSTPNGDRLVQDINSGDIVISTTHNLNDIDLKVVNEVSTREYNDEIITFSINVDGKIKQVSCTPCHLFPILREEKQMLCQAKDILETDELFFLVESKDH